jgi:hypothetical protein
MFKPQIGPRVLSVRALLLALAAVGCGEVTSTQQGLVTPAADAGAQVDQLQAADAGAQVDQLQAADAGAQVDQLQAADAGAGETAAAADAGAEHPALHCGPSTEFRFEVCKPGCGICTHQTSTSTIEGCWTNDTDFHCVHGCGDCR